MNKNQPKQAPYEFNGSPLNFQPTEILADIRNFRALRVPHRTAETIVKHEKFRALCVYLALKPLYISGVIFGADKLPYTRIAEFFGFSVSNTRNKIRELKDLHLISFEGKNIRLASYQKFCQVIGVTTSEKNVSLYKHKYTFQNNTDIYNLLRALAIAENIERQKKAFIYKTVKAEIKNRCFDLVVNQYQDAKQMKLNFDRTTERLNNPRFIKRISKKLHLFEAVKNDLQTHVDSCTVLYDHQIAQIFMPDKDNPANIVKRFPEKNPYFSLSCKGVAKLIGRKAVSTGHYTQYKLLQAGYIEQIFKQWVGTDNRATGWDILQSNREDAFNICRPNGQRAKKCPYGIRLQNDFVINMISS